MAPLHDTDSLQKEFLTALEKMKPDYDKLDVNDPMQRQVMRDVVAKITYIRDTLKNLDEQNEIFLKAIADAERIAIMLTSDATEPQDCLNAPPVHLLTIFFVIEKLQSIRAKKPRPTWYPEKQNMVLAEFAKWQQHRHLYKNQKAFISAMQAKTKIERAETIRNWIKKTRLPG